MSARGVFTAFTSATTLEALPLPPSSAAGVSPVLSLTRGLVTCVPAAGAAHQGVYPHPGVPRPAAATRSSYNYISPVLTRVLTSQWKCRSSVAPRGGSRRLNKHRGTAAHAARWALPSGHPPAIAGWPLSLPEHSWRGCFCTGVWCCCLWRAIGAVHVGCPFDQQGSRQAHSARAG